MLYFTHLHIDFEILIELCIQDILHCFVIVDPSPHIQTFQLIRINLEHFCIHSSRPMQKNHHWSCIRLLFTYDMSMQSYWPSAHVIWFYLKLKKSCKNLSMVKVIHPSKSTVSLPLYGNFKRYDLFHLSLYVVQILLKVLVMIWV